MTEPKTEPKTTRTGPRLALGPIELRLYLIAMLAGVYVMVWLLVWRAPATSPAVDPTTDPTVDPTVDPAIDPAPRSSPARVVAAPQGRAPAIWFDELPEALRPAVRLPAGWRLASRRELLEGPAAPAVAATAAVPRVVRAPAKRRPRLRTRSS